MEKGMQQGGGGQEQRMTERKRDIFSGAVRGVT